MATNFPTSLDNLTNPASTNELDAPSHSQQHADANDAIEALETKVGINNSENTTSLDYRVRQLETVPTYTDEMAQDASAALFNHANHVNLTATYDDVGNQVILTGVGGTANKISQEVINNTGSTLYKGQVVYANGAVGASGQLRVALSSNASEGTSSKTFGIMEDTVVDGAIGTVITEGLIEGIDTSSAQPGDPVWLGSTPGSVIYGLANKPSAPQHLVFVGIVTRAQQETGSIFVKVQNGFELDELHDVYINGKQDNQVLRYDSTTGLWTNQTIDNLFEPAGAVSAHSSDTTNIHGIADTADLATKAYADNAASAAAAAIVDAAPATLDTLNELAAALGDDPNYATTITTALGDKVSKSGGDIITSSLPSVIGLTIKGATSQTANLQEWQNSSGAVLAKVDASGSIYTASTTVWAGYNRAADGAALYNFTTVAGATYAQAAITRSSGFNGNLTISQQGNGAVVVQNGSASAIGLIVKGSASQTANLQEWQNNSGTVLAKITATGDTTFGYTYISGVRDINGTGAYINMQSADGVLLNTRSASNRGLVIKGSSSQTATLLEFVDSNNNSLGAFNSNGLLYVGSINNRVSFNNSRIQLNNNGLLVDTGVASNVALTVQSTNASQTADIQQWKNSTGTVLAKVDASGAMFTTTAAVGTDTTQVATTAFVIDQIDASTQPGALYQTTAPTSPEVGQIWIDSDDEVDVFDKNIIRRQTFTAVAEQDTFTTDIQFIPGYEQVFMNGILLLRNTDYTTPTDHTVVLTADATAGDIIDVLTVTNLNSVNTYTQAEINTLLEQNTSVAPLSISADTNLVAKKRYFVTSASALTLTLPASPALNDEIQIVDASGNASTYNITVARNGNLINGGTGNLIIDNNGGWYTLLYTGSTYGWKVG